MAFLACSLNVENLPLPPAAQPGLFSADAALRDCRVVAYFPPLYFNQLHAKGVALVVPH